MRLSLFTWNSTNINDGSPFYSVIPRGQLSNFRLNPVLTPRAGDYPALSSVVKQGSILMLHVRIAAGSDISTNREILKKHFFTDELKHNLIAKDEADSDRQYCRSGIPVGLAEEQGAPNSFFVTIQTDYPYWQLVTAVTDNWAITGTADTQAVTNIGNQISLPIFTITPTTTKTGGLSYRRYVPIYNNMDLSSSLPLDITGGGLNTAAVIADTTVSNQINVGGGINDSVTTWAIDTSVGGGLPAGGGMFYFGTEQCTYTSISAGSISGVTRGVNGTSAAAHADNVVMYRSKAQADGHDLRVWMDNAETYRWLSGINTATTKIWVNLPLSARIESTLLAGVSDSATTLTFPQTKATTTFLQALSTTTNQTLLIESEAITFDPVNIDYLNYQITSVTRGQKNTTAAAHIATTAVRYIQHDLWILYGDSTLTAPDVDDNSKPIFDLTSTNGIWTYTNYFDDGLSRPGAWKGEVLASRTHLSYCYTASSNVFADPSTALGLALRGSSDFTVQNENGTLDWFFSHPAGITDITFSGQKYRTGSWPGIVGLQYLQSQTIWFTAQEQSQPELTVTWENFGPTTLALGGTRDAIRFVIDGVLSSVINEIALIEFYTVSVTFATANLPTIAVGAEVAVNYFDAKISNTTTSEFIKFKAVCPVNTALTIDTESRSAYLPDGRTIPITLSSNRSEWLKLNPGANTLQWDDVGTVAITATVVHRDRVL